MNNKDVVEEDKVQDEGRATEASKEPKVDDEELDALLDDALGGFDNPKVGVAQKQEATDETKVNDTVWSEEFMQQASAEFERNIRLMMGESGSDIGDFSESLLKVSQEAAAKVFENQADSFGASFADTLKYLAEGTESLQSEPDEAALAKMLEKMAFGADSELQDGADGDISLRGLGEILPAMQGMLQSLMSKELLYPSIKDIVNKYPDWLADNRSKLESSEFEKYNRQFSIMQQVCTEFESEDASDDEQTRNTRFETILSLMQQMQECGHPPKELAGEAVNLPNPFGAQGLPDFSQAMPPGADKCILM